MNAEDVVIAALDAHLEAFDAWVEQDDDDLPEPCDGEMVIAALRAAVGGGPVVILEDGTLATIDKEIPPSGTWTRLVPLVRVVPVGGEPS